jgi:enamine deaminase RidA (YjgF/YER057c/UK114 family)
MILIELTAAIDAAGTLATFYVSTDGFVTSPTDTPANTAFRPCVMDPGSIGLHAFSDGRTGGATKLETGEIVLANADGQFDAWLNYSFDGRPAIIRSGAGGAYPGAFSVVLSGTVENVDATWERVVIRLKDKQFKFQLPARATLYGGANSLPNGLDGVPGDLQGKVRPLAYGQVFNASPPMVNTSRLIYETGVCNSVDAVYDGASPLTAGAVYTSQSDMETNAPASGAYRAWLVGGYIRLGLQPVNELTADLTAGANAAARTVAQTIKALALAAGLSAGEISAADVTSLDTANSAVVGIWLNDANTTFANAMDQIAASIGAWYGFDGTGTLRMGRLTAPSGTPVTTLYDYHYQDGIERRPPRDNGTPVWSVTVNHTKSWTVQKSGLTGSATAVRRSFVTQEYRSANVQDATVKTQWRLSGALEVDGLLTTTADATAETARLLAIHKVRRDVFDVPVDISLLTSSGLRIMDVVAVQGGRFNMNPARLFRVMGISLNLDRSTVIFTVWG